MEKNQPKRQPKQNGAEEKKESAMRQNLNSDTTLKEALGPNTKR
jgi:hypothetical protein